MEEVILRKVNNGWMLIFDDPEFEHPDIEVKEGRLNGLIDGFIDTFLMPHSFGDDIDTNKMFSVKISVEEIAGFETDAIKLKKRDLI